VARAPLELANVLDVAVVQGDADRVWVEEVMARGAVGRFDPLDGGGGGARLAPPFVGLDIGSVLGSADWGDDREAGGIGPPEKPKLSRQPRAASLGRFWC